MSGKYYSFRDEFIVGFLSEAIQLEPLSLFMYTWIFLEFI